MSLNVRRLVGVLLPPHAEVQDLRRRLSRAQDVIDYWRQRYERRTATADRLKKMVDDMRRRLLDVQRHADAQKRGQLSDAILEQLLPIRAQQRPVSGCDTLPASQREQRLLKESPPYRAAIEGEASRTACLQRVQVLGIPWWVPRDEATAGRVEKLQAQGFPLRAILQTREVALGGIMLDLGANIGRTSITRAILGDVRAVYAAEPEPVNYACLVQNVVEHRLRGWVLPDRVAIGAERGEVQLRRSAHVGGHRVFRDRRRHREGVETIRVPLWSVDEWMARLGVEPEAVSFVKVDTQGSEVEVLRGARGLLARRHVAWQIEVDPKLLKYAGTTMEELLGLLATHFTHFIDLAALAGSARMRRTCDLTAALAYVGREQPKTDLIVYNTT